VPEWRAVDRCIPGSHGQPGQGSNHSGIAAFPPTGDTLTPLSATYRTMSDPALTLYRLQACPFCERVVRTLDDLGLSSRSRFVEPMHSDRDVVKRLSGKRTVPALVDDNTGVTLTESANIVDYLETTYGEGGVAADVADEAAVGRAVGGGDA
jgi:glutaredoxin